MPFCKITFTALKATKIPTILKTLGDRIRKRRIELNLYQSEVAQIVGVDATTVYNWERSGSKPTLRVIPKIIEFLGYVPELLKAQTLGEKIILYRTFLGMSQKELARELNIDPSTLGRWKRNEVRPGRELGEMLATLFEDTILSVEAPGQQSNY